MVAIGPSARATTAMPRIARRAITTTGSPAPPPMVAAASPNKPKSTELVTTPFLPSVGLSNGTISIL